MSYRNEEAEGCMFIAAACIVAFLSFVGFMAYDAKHWKPARDEAARVREAEELAKTKVELERFGHAATIMGFHDGMGKEDTHCRGHPYVIVENAKGERKRIRLHEEPALAGDTWSLRAMPYGILLEARLDKKIPAM